MSAPVTPAPAAAHVLAHELVLEVNTSATDSPTWTKVRFASAINPTVTPTNNDATTYDDEGTDHPERVGETWAVAFTVNRYRTAGGDYLPEHEVLRKAADPGVRGAEAVVEVRYYDKGGADEAYQGKASVGWTRGNTGPKDLGTAAVSLTGQGPLTPIANPAAGA